MIESEIVELITLLIGSAALLGVSLAFLEAFFGKE